MGHNIPKARWTPDEYRSRPREYDPTLADEIVERVRNGEMLPVICQDRDMPMPGTFLMWCEQDASLEERYIAARRIGTDVCLDEAVVQSMAPDPAVAGARSRALMWYVERSRPDKYGPRATVNLQSTEKEKPGGGIDYAAEVRRKLDEMAKRRREETRAQDAATRTSDTG